MLAFARKIGGLTGCLCAGLISSSALTAGEVTLSYDTGVLTITGTAVPDHVSVSGTAVRTTVRAGLGTTFANATTFRERRNRVFNNVAAIVFNGNGGDDSLQVRVSVGSLTYAGGAQDDTLTVTTGSLGSLTAVMGGGDDRVVLQTGVSNLLDIDLGDGANTLAINQSMLAALMVTSGSGSDLMFFTDVTSAPMVGMLLSISTGGGDDIVGFQNCEVIAPDPMMPAILDGGDDNDSLGQDLSIFTPVPVPENFEVVIGFDPPPPPPAAETGASRPRRR